ncbi:MAG: hypothetical protein GY913_03315 [Proteobacteria bacterium]|nr:hypothetical protein [Pseudomonadota bacterium]MCP4915930.1 hypothetical protein [Pseudomonadota bacterium]
MALILLTFGLLVGAFAVGLLRLRIPGWQNRASLGHAAVTALLGFELWLVLAFWQLEAAPGLSSGVPLLALLACGALALIATQRGATPAAASATAWWRAGSAALAIGAMAVWWQHLEALVPLGRTDIERDLIANTSTIGAFAVLGVALVALVPVLTSVRSFRRTAVPIAAAAALSLPLFFVTPAATIDATCDAAVEHEGTWCREITTDLPIVESYKINDGAWEPVGGPLMSTTERLRTRQELSKKTWKLVFAERDHAGTRLDDWMEVDGFIGPTTVTSSLGAQLGAMDACLSDAEEREALEPGAFPVSIRIEADGWKASVTDLPAGDAELRSCIEDTLVRGRTWTRAAGPTDISFGLRYLGQPQEVASAG